MQALAEGNLTVDVPVGTVPPIYHSRNEVGQMAQAMRTIIIRTKEIVTAYETAWAN